MIARGYQRAERSAARGVPVEQFAALVERILLAERTRKSYIIGTGTWLAATLARLLPDRWMDAIIRRTY